MLKRETYTDESLNSIKCRLFIQLKVAPFDVPPNEYEYECECEYEYSLGGEVNSVTYERMFFIP